MIAFLKAMVLGAILAAVVSAVRSVRASVAKRYRVEVIGDRFMTKLTRWQRGIGVRAFEEDAGVASDAVNGHAT